MKHTSLQATTLPRLYVLSGHLGLLLGHLLGLGLDILDITNHAVEGGDLSVRARCCSYRIK